MIRLLLIVVVVLIVWSIFRMMNREATLEEARTIGLEKARLQINNPILLEDYTEEKKIPMEQLVSLIEQGKIPIFRWRQYTYIENRELISIKK
mgnify:CR=1 FL=1